MNGTEFQEKVLDRMSNIERDMAYVKGVIEGRDHSRSMFKDNVSIGISCVSLLVSAVLVLTRLF